MELNELIERVGKLFNRFGIKSVTMDDIARELGISKKTLYQYVDDKNTLVEKCLVYEMEYMEKCFIQRKPSKDKNAIEELFEVNRMLQKVIAEKNPSREYDLKKYYPELFKRFWKFRSETMQKAVMNNLLRGQQQGIYRKELKAEYIARFYVSRIDITLANEFILQPKEIKPDFFIEIFIYHIRGIASQEGLHYLEKNLNKLNDQPIL